MMKNLEEKKKRAGRTAEVAVAALCLGFLVVHGIYAARVNSVTVDEYVHLPAALAVLQTGNLELDHAGSPPLRAAAALPALAARPVMDYGSGLWESRNTYGFSWLFMKNNFRRYHELYFGPRLAVLCVAAVLGVFVFAAAGLVFGPFAAGLAVFLFAFNPEIMAHGPLMTVDMLVACFFLPLFIFSFVLFKRRAHLIPWGWA